jgi:hypothetical protein
MMNIAQDEQLMRAEQIAERDGLHAINGAYWQVWPSVKHRSLGCCASYATLDQPALSRRCDL